MKMNLDDPKLTAYALDELSGAEEKEMQTAVAASPEAQEFVREMRLFTGNLRAEYGAEREAHEARPVSQNHLVLFEQEDTPWSISRRLALAAAIALCACLGALAIGTMQRSERSVGAGLNLPPRAPRVAAKDVLQTPVQGILPPAEEEEGPNPTLPIARDLVASAPAAPPPVSQTFAARSKVADASMIPGAIAIDNFQPGTAGSFNTARYGKVEENPFLAAVENPLSTFSIDVDTASYSNIRRFIEGGSLPPKDAIRVEEMINYFAYDYPQPNDEAPFSVNLDAASCPWAPGHRLVRIGLQGRELPNEKRPASNLVFLLDVSGSMMPANRLPLVKQALRLLVEKLGKNDRVAVVVYSGASGLALPSTSGEDKEKILSALENLQAGGSTNGAQGIELAYQTAAEHFIKGGVNRVILATDGDFNIGTTSEGELVRLIEASAKSGVFLSVLGVGDNNLNDSMMQKLAGQGNGNYAYLDSIAEAKKVLVRQINATLVTIAKDVKIQVEFNPAQVASYRLIGYEKRLLRKEDFNNDQIDAGEIGAGHSVTALYEVVSAGAEPNPAASVPPVDPLKYQPSKPVLASLGKIGTPELLTVKLRYKEPAGERSKLLARSFVDHAAPFAKAAPDFKFAVAVAEFGMILRDSAYKGEGTLGAVAEWAEEGKGADGDGYRAGFLQLVQKARTL